MPACVPASPRGGDRPHPFDEGDVRARDRDRIPPERRDRQFRLNSRSRAPKAGIDLREASPMRHGRPDAIKPGALIRGPRGRERGARKLLGIKAVGAFLRRVAPDRQRPRECLGFEAVAEAGKIADLGGRRRRVRNQGGTHVHGCLPREDHGPRFGRLADAFAFERLPQILVALGRSRSADGRSPAPRRRRG